MFYWLNEKIAAFTPNPKLKTFFRLRTQNSYYPYEPVQVLGDGNCLYRSISKALFGNENKWDLIKLGSLSYLKSNRDPVLEHVRDTTLFVKSFTKLGRLHV